MVIFLVPVMHGLDVVIVGGAVYGSGMGGRGSLGLLLVASYSQPHDECNCLTSSA